MKTRPARVYIYGEPRAASLEIEKIKSFVGEKTGFEVGVRPSIFDSFLNQKAGGAAAENLAEKLARCKVRDLTKPISLTPLKGEIDYEKNRITDPDSRAYGLLYDGFKLVSIFSGLLPEAEKNLSFIHIIFTNQLVGTWDPGDRRYHARVAVFSFPSIISTAGVVEAPAKPKEYYWLKQQTLSLGLDVRTLADFKKEHQRELLEHDDPRLTEVLKGYVLQAIYQHLGAELFCEDKNCRLFNAHWQKEVIKAQLEGEYEFCPKHQRFFQQLREKTEKRGIVGAK